MTYSANSDVFLAFGERNVRKWADIESTNIQAVIEARIEWAREQAYDELNSRLASSKYKFPLDELAENEAYPPILVRMEAYLTGVLLYESRGVTDVDDEGNPKHALRWHRKAVETFVTDIHAGRLQLLNAPLTDEAEALGEVMTTPDFVSFDDPLDETRCAAEMSDNLIDFET